MKTNLAPRLSRPVAAPLDFTQRPRKEDNDAGKVIDASPSSPQPRPHILDTFTPAIAGIPASRRPQLVPSSASPVGGVRAAGVTEAQAKGDSDVKYGNKPVVESAITKALESGKPSTTAPQQLQWPDPAFIAEHDKFMEDMQGVGMTRLEAAGTWSTIRQGLLQEVAKEPGVPGPKKNRHFDKAAKMMAPYLTVEKGKDAALWSGGYDTSKYAQLQGHTTLESTAAGRVIAGLEFYKDPKAVTPLWNSLSEEFVKQIPKETPVHVFMRTHDPRSVLYQYEVPQLGGLENKNLRWHPMVGVDAKSMQEVQPGLKLGSSADGYAKESEARMNLKNHYTQHPDAQKAVAADLMKLP